MYIPNNSKYNNESNTYNYYNISCINVYSFDFLKYSYYYYYFL